jgi:hypothetical protein
MRTAAIGLGLCTALGFSACGGGSADEPTLQEYFERVQQLSADADGKSEEIDEEYAHLFDGTDEEFGPESREEYERYFRAQLDPLDDLADGLSGVDAPSDVSDEHDRLVAVFKDIRGSYETFIDEIGGVDTNEDLAEVFFSNDFIAAASEFEAACKNLQAIADDRDISVDLECES